MSFVLLIIGFALLIKGADIFVEGSSSIARKFNVPPMIIGLTIVAMGTSAPEASVSISSSLAGQNDMSIANVVGSNFFNLLIVLGVSSIIAKLPVQEDTIKKDGPFLILASLVLLVLSFDSNLGRLDGVIFLALFAYFLISMIKSASKANSIENEESAMGSVAVDEKADSMGKTIVLCLIGLAGIVFGGDMVVSGASAIAADFGMSPNLVGLTIVAVGTSLPEFVTSVVAIRKGETEIAIGNVVGSNIFNILLVLGIAAVISPMAVSFAALTDVIFMCIITVLMFFAMKKNNSLVKAHGFICIATYIAYLVYTIVR